MKYTTLGTSDVKISKICLGTMTWGKQNNQDEAFEQMNYALSEGVNFFDTAEMYAIPPTADTYGKTEAIIGNWLEATGKRSQIVLATKFSPLPWARGEVSPVIDKKNIITAVENSLKRLKTNYIDLYQLHWPTNRSHYHFSNWWDFEPASGLAAKEKIVENKIEILQTLQSLVDEGKIRNIGLSDDSAWGIKQYVELSEKHDLPRIMSIQNEYNLLRRRDEYDVAETCSLEEVSYFPWSPLAMGVLSGKYLNDKFPDKSRFSKEVMGDGWDRYNSRVELNTHNATAKYLDIAKKYNLDPCQMAIAFVLSRKWVSSAIVGATNMGQLKNNIAAIDLDLTPDCLGDIHEIYRQYPVAF
jgi:aryl-alcohol dehydrogenase-like predicted oxidoreductase